MSLLFAGIGRGQPPILPSTEKQIIDADIQRYTRAPMVAASHASEWLDVTYYRLNLRINTSPQLLSGDVLIKGRVNEDNPPSLVLDLKNTMHIDSVRINGELASFVQDSDFFTITLDSIVHSGDLLDIEISYEGLPIATGFGSFLFGEHSGKPWVWSLSEPYGARDWWPCKDHPSDKADSADIIVTCNSSFKVGSNGLLRSVIDNGDGTSTFRWHEGYPIANYLISVAITNYTQFSNWFRYSTGDSMEVLNYVLPEHLSDALNQLSKTIDMLTIYSRLYGLYPFINEKYGHSEFGSGGAMEHQTMTSTTTFAEEVIAHELAHQWFGDMITCRTWQNLWLNEGFAQYSTALYYEQEYGSDMYWSYMSGQLSNARFAVGSVFVQDTSVVRDLFSSARVYSKGAVVLHMLRHVLGDSVFFHAMYNYANDPALKYGTATTADFQRVCETTSSTDLSYFFNEWIFGEKYPRYEYSWSVNSSGGASALTLLIDQSDSANNPSFFTMPIDVRIRGIQIDTLVRIFNDTPHQRLTVPLHAGVVVQTVMLDPEGWILKDAIQISPSPVPSGFRLEQNFPNPFNDRTTIRYELPHQTSVRLVVFNLVGEMVATLADYPLLQPGRYTFSWNVSSDRIPSGVYFYRMQTPFGQETKKLLILR